MNDAVPMFANEPRLEIDKLDFHSATWEAIQKYGETKIAAYQRRMEDLSTSDQDRRDYAVRIAEWREFLGKKSAPPRARATPVNYS